MSSQSNAVSHWLGTNLESALKVDCITPVVFTSPPTSMLYRPSCRFWLNIRWLRPMTWALSLTSSHLLHPSAQGSMPRSRTFLTNRTSLSDNVSLFEAMLDLPVDCLQQSITWLLMSNCAVRSRGINWCIIGRFYPEYYCFNTCLGDWDLR